MRCRNCDHDGNCWAAKNYPIYHVSHFAAIDRLDVKGMMEEIKARGPISCAFYSSEPVHTYTGGIITSPPKDPSY